MFSNSVAFTEKKVALSKRVECQRVFSIHSMVSVCNKYFLAFVLYLIWNKIAARLLILENLSAIRDLACITVQLSD